MKQNISRKKADDADRTDSKPEIESEFRKTESFKRMRAAFLINIIFTLIEAAGGLLTNSVAILSDAVHDLGDSITLGSSLYFEKISYRKRTDAMTFGYRRYSLLGALITAGVLIGGSVYILYLAVPRLLDPEPVHAEGMIVMALLGMFFNGFAYFRLSSGHHHSHEHHAPVSENHEHREHTHHDHKSRSRRHGSSAHLHERVVSLHLLEDLFGWAAVFLVSIVMMFADVPILDPILSIVITMFVMIQVIPSIRTIGRIFLQYSPKDIPLEEVRSELSSLNDAVEVHDLHIWTLDGNLHICTCHIVIPGTMQLEDALQLKDAAKLALKRYGIEHSTVELEAEGSSCAHCEL